MKTIKLIIVADEPVLFFSSITAAENYLEAIDVEDGVYSKVFGARGELYNIGTNKSRVVITPALNEKTQPEELRSILLSFLSFIQKTYSEDESLEHLIQRCAGHITT